MKLICAFFIVQFLVFVSTQKASRVSNSPYPVSKLVKTAYTISTGSFTKDESLMIQSLSGIVGQDEDNGGDFIYTLLDNADSMWLTQLVSQRGIAVNRTFQNDPLGIVHHFASFGALKGYILYDFPASIEAAVSLSGVSKSLLVTPGALEYYAISYGLHKSLDVRGSDLKNILSTYSSQFSYRVMTHMPAAETYSNFLSDYAIFAKAFSFADNDLTDALSTEAYTRLYLTSAVLGWASSEGDYVGTTSHWSKYLNAADYSTNLPLLSNIESNGLLRRVGPGPVPPSENVHYVTFVMTDGDNIQWLQRAFMDEKWYGSPLRGKFPVGWTISPALLELAPTIASYIINSATPNDDFIAAPSGVGYIHPSTYPHNQYGDLKLYTDLTAAYMRKLNFSIVTIIDNNYDSSSVSQFLSEDQIEAAVLFLGDGYTNGILGNVYWEGNKFATGPRWILSTSMGPQKVTPSQLAQKINSASTNVRSKDAWDIVPVHVWTMSMEDIQTAISMFAPHVKVVTPTDYVRLFKQFRPT